MAQVTPMRARPRDAVPPQAPQDRSWLSDEGVRLDVGADGRIVNRDSARTRAVIVRIHGKTYQHVAEDAMGAWVYARI